MIKKEEFRHNGMWVTHVTIERERPRRVSGETWSVWGLGIYTSWKDALNAIEEYEKELQKPEVTKKG